MSTGQLCGDRQVLGTVFLPARALLRTGRCVEGPEGSHACNVPAGSSWAA